jgi:hypothetical protein
MRRGFLGLAFAVTLLAHGVPLLAEEPVATATVPEVTVTAPRGLTSGGIAPLLELPSSELESYGVDTLSDLVDALKPLTHSSRSDGAPVVLINGRLSGMVEFANLPSDAVERVEVLPETVALQYGFSANQRVLNFVLRAPYRTLPARWTESGATEGGDRTTQVDASLVQLAEESRVTLIGSFQNNAKLLESDRGIDQPDSIERTLQPDKTEDKIAATVSRAILGVSSSLEGSFDRVMTQSLQGAVDVANLPTPLPQSANQTTAYLAGKLTGQVGRFMWDALGSYTPLITNSSDAIGLGDAGNLASDRTSAVSNAGNLQVSMSGRIARLPAGSIVANLKAGLQYQGLASENSYPGTAAARSKLVRSVRSAHFNTDLPITSRDNHAWAGAGDLSATVNLSLDDVSNFGALLSQSYGLDWTPIQKAHFNAIWTDHQTPPTVQQVLAPETITPNVEMFDFGTSQTVYAISITGGDPTLHATDDRVASVGMSFGPFSGRTMFSAYCEHHRTRDPVGTLPPLTADVELAFPDRLIRDADGTLIEVDNRSVNLQRQDLNDVKWGFNAWFPFGNSSKGETPNRFEFSTFDTWYLKDEILIRDGIPTLNLLNGAPLNGVGGQPRHQIDWTALLFKDGLGATLNGTWKSATSVGTGDALSSDTLHFSALGTVNLRLFADLSRLPTTHDHEWAHGLRVAVQMLNLFDRRQSVQDSAGLTPLAFAPGYLDPAGRTVSLTVRKAFQ